MGKDDAGNALNWAHRRKFLLSGLLVCGCCGGVYTVVGRDRYGCATRRAKGTCSNRTTVTRRALEARVLGGLKEKLMAPELIAEFVRTFQEEINAAARAVALRGGELKREADGIQRKVAGIMAAIEDGMYTPAFKERMKALEQRKAAIDGLLAGSNAPPVIRLHSDIAEVYRLKVAGLEVALNDDSIKAEAGEVLRSLIDCVVLTPSGGRSRRDRGPAPWRSRRHPGLERQRWTQTKAPGQGQSRESTVDGCGGGKPPTVDSAPRCSVSPIISLPEHCKYLFLPA